METSMVVRPPCVAPARTAPDLLIDFRWVVGQYCGRTLGWPEQIRTSTWREMG